ncbi:hypothetical protein ABZ892_11550 [Streptomyces sp. NPDC046924]|uniref:hypothetical protein n=1 Tax=Streptomyces sp. NPDC046924 TaxID=3155136 RepID=UPI0033E21963
MSTPARPRPSGRRPARRQPARRPRPVLPRRADGRLLPPKRERRRARADAVDRDVLVSGTAPVNVDERTRMQVVGLTDAGGTDALSPR